MGESPERGCQPSRTLRGHHVTWLDSDHVTITGLVRARTRANVHDRTSAAQCSDDELAKAGLLLTSTRITVPDAVVPRTGHLSRLSIRTRALIVIHGDSDRYCMRRLSGRHR